MNTTIIIIIGLLAAGAIAIYFFNDASKAKSVAKKPSRKRANKVTKEIIEEVKDITDRSDFRKGKDEDPLVKLAKKSRKSRNRKAKK